MGNPFSWPPVKRTEK